MDEDQLVKALDGYFKQDRKFIDTSRIPLICQDIRSIHTAMKEINEKLDNKFVTKESFSPVKQITFGLVGLILTLVFTAVVYSIIKTHI